MAITRANVESVLLTRAKKRMVVVGMDAITKDGTNADLDDPIAKAARVCGLQLVSLTVTDGDLATLDPADFDKLLDVAELRLLESIHNNFDMVDIKVGPRSENLSQMGGQIMKAIEYLTAKCLRDYGIGSEISAGSIAFDFQQKESE